MPSASAAAEAAATIDDEVPNLTCATADPGDQLSPGDDCSPHPSTNKAAEKVGHPLSSAKRQLPGRRHLHIIAQGRGNTESFAQRLGDRQINHRLAQVRCAQQYTLFDVHLPG